MKTRLKHSMLHIALLVGVTCAAQDPAYLRVHVTDQDGAAVRDATLRLDGEGRTPRSTTSKSSGEANFTRLPVGIVKLTVTASGFESQVIDPVELRPGANKLEVRLQVGNLSDEVQVTLDKREANTDPRGDGMSSVLTAEQLALLPDDPDEFEQAIRNMAGPGARMRVNGFTGGKLPPKSQIREIRFRMNQFAAENHDPSFVTIDIYTKPGVNLWHGSVNFGFRDESLNARNSLAPVRGPEQDRRYGFEVSGPLWKNHTSVFFSGDGMNSFDTKTIVTALPGGYFSDLVQRPTNRLNLQARVEHALNKTHTLRGEYQRNFNRQQNLGVGNFDLADRAYNSDSTEHIVRVSDSGAFGRKLFNELRFQTTWRDVAINSLSSATTIQVLDAFTSGGAQLASSNRLRQTEITDNLDISFIRKHLIRTGLTLEAGRYSSSEIRNPNGTFTFANLADYLAGRPLQYSRRSGSPVVDFNQYQLGLYLQDDWRLKKDLTLSFGVRQELQTNLADKSNIAPRVSFAWSPFKDGKTTIRGGSGIFYDWFGTTTLEQILRVNGQQQTDLIVRNPGYPDPFSGGSLTVLPPSVLQASQNLRMPYVVQSSLGIEKELPHSIRVMTNFAYTRGIHQLRAINANQPIPGLGSPFPLQGNITRVSSIANSTVKAAMINVSWSNLPKGIFLAGNYRFSKTTNEADSPFSLPVDSYNLRAERGPAANDFRHVFFVMAGLPVYQRVRIGTTFNYVSAAPYNITTGFDGNGDAIINDRPAGFSRNSARGSGQVNLGLRLGWSIGFGKAKESGGQQMQVRVVRAGGGGDMLGSIPGGGMSLAAKRVRTEFYVQASNILNHANRTNFTGVQTSPFFGQATAALAPRRLETGMRLSF